MPVHGSISPPGDKSVSHRVLIIAALSEGPCRVGGVLAAGDTRATAAALRSLGVRVTQLVEGRHVIVHGGGLRPFRQPRGPIRCHNSGTTARLLMGALAAHRLSVRLVGDRSLSKRPMERVASPLRTMGARITLAPGGRLPALVEGGPLTPVRYASPVSSAQVKTALLLAGLSGGVQVTVSEPVVSRDHTERLLALLGARLMRDGGSVTLAPPARLFPFEGTVPGDISSAAYLIGAAVLATAGELVVKFVGVNPTRTGFLDALERMGASLDIEDVDAALGEPVATIVARPARLSAVQVEPRDVPRMVDEIPLLACLAARAEGTSVFRGIGELRVKESDRLALIAKNLTKLGVRAHSEGDTLYVEGTDRPPRGLVETAGDHRLAMAFTVLGTLPGARVKVDDQSCVAVSYPRFFADLKAVLS